MQTAFYPELIEEVSRDWETLAEGQPKVMKAFSELIRAAKSPGALDTKTKEIIALAIGVAAHCDGCIAFHTQGALKAGATRAEIMDALGVAVMMGGGPSVVYAARATKALNELEE